MLKSTQLSRYLETKQSALVWQKKVVSVVILRGQIQDWIDSHEDLGMYVSQWFWEGIREIVTSLNPFPLLLPYYWYSIAYRMNSQGISAYGLRYSSTLISAVGNFVAQKKAELLILFLFATDDFFVLFLSNSSYNSFGHVTFQATNENLPPNVIKQLAKELKSLDESPPEGIQVGLNDDDFSIIYADIEGPAGTPYENGVFHMKLLLSRDFPHSPPKGYFLTKIFHPNIATNGEICVNTLKKDWNPSLGLRHVLIVVRCLLIEPFPESALNEQAGKMLLENYEEYARHARLYTGIHAKPKHKFKTGAISESTTALNVDQTNTLTLNADQKNTAPGAALLVISASPSLLAPSTVATRGNGQDQAPVVAPMETGVGGSATTVRKEGGLTKAQVEKKKIDARKKSLKRL
ncbi:hypothetical protein EV2_009616 [Malus domestica]